MARVVSCEISTSRAIHTCSCATRAKFVCTTRARVVPYDTSRAVRTKHESCSAYTYGSDSTIVHVRVMLSLYTTRANVVPYDESYCANLARVVQHTYSRILQYTRIHKSCSTHMHESWSVCMHESCSIYMHDSCKRVVLLCLVRQVMQIMISHACDNNINSGK